MSLLSDLLASLPPTPAGTQKSIPPSWPSLALVEHRPEPVTGRRTPAQRYPSARTNPFPNACPNAASASPEWRKARDLYLSHVLTCQSCYAPSARHCPAGASLRATYDNTHYGANPMISQSVSISEPACEAAPRSRWQTGQLRDGRPDCDRSVAGG